MGVLFAEDEVANNTPRFKNGWKLVLIGFLFLLVIFNFFNIKLDSTNVRSADHVADKRVPNILRLSEINSAGIVKSTPGTSNNPLPTVIEDSIVTTPENNFTSIDSDQNAERLYLQKILANSQDRQSYQALLQIYENQQRTKDSEQLLLQAIQLNPESSEFEHRLLKHYLIHGEQQKADAMIGKLNTNKIKNADFLAFLAVHYQRRNQVKNTIKLYQQALAIKPQETQWWLGLGFAYESREQWRDAKKAYVNAGDGGEKVDALLANIALKQTSQN